VGQPNHPKDNSPFAVCPQVITLIQTPLRLKRPMLVSTGMSQMMNDDSRTFESNTLRMLGDAFDEAWERLGRAGCVSVDRNDLAKHIIALAITGERDRKKLVDSALVAVTQQPPILLTPSPYRQFPKASQ
jgi:hypothetical protein